jgi:hypothetical protein
MECCLCIQTWPYSILYLGVDYSSPAFMAVVLLHVQMSCIKFSILTRLVKYIWILLWHFPYHQRKLIWKDSANFVYAILLWSSVKATLLNCIASLLPLLQREHNLKKTSNVALANARASPLSFILVRERERVSSILFNMSKVIKKHIYILMYFCDGK